MRLCVDGPVLEAASARRGGLSRRGPSAACPSPIRSSTPRERGTRSPRGAAFGDALLRGSPYSPSIPQDGNARAAPGQPAAAAVGAAAGDGATDRAADKGLEGYLAHDLPGARRAAGAADRQRHGLRPPRTCDLLRVFGEREEVAALELNVSCPNVKTGLLMGADPGETAALIGRRPRAPGEADHREADAELHRRRPRSRGAPRLRAGAGAMSFVGTVEDMAMNTRRPGEQLLGGEHRRRLRPGGPRRGTRAGVRSARGSRSRSRDRRGPAGASCSSLLDPGADLSPSARSGSAIRRGGGHRRRARKLRGSFAIQQHKPARIAHRG